MKMIDIKEFKNLISKKSFIATPSVYGRDIVLSNTVFEYLEEKESESSEIIEFPHMIKLGKDEKGIMSTMTYFKARDIESDAIYHRKIIDKQNITIKQLRFEIARLEIR